MLFGSCTLPSSIDAGAGLLRLGSELGDLFIRASLVVPVIAKREELAQHVGDSLALLLGRCAGQLVALAQISRQRLLSHIVGIEQPSISGILQHGQMRRVAHVVAEVVLVVVHSSAAQENTDEPRTD